MLDQIPQKVNPDFKQVELLTKNKHKQFQILGEL